MRRLLLTLLGMMAVATAANAQVTLVPSSNVVGPGTNVTATVTGPAGQNFAVIGSNTNSGLSYAGVSLAVGTDVAVLGVGVLNGSGEGTVTFTPPFPARDRFYIQAVASPAANFTPLTASAGVVLMNNQEARLFMPIGGFIQANGNALFITPGVTVTKAGNQYTIAHPGLFALGSPLPNITPSAGATITSLSTNANQTVVTLSTEAGFVFTIEQVRR
jgi:hypothetical protein